MQSRICIPIYLLRCAIFPCCGLTRTFHPASVRIRRSPDGSGVP